MEDARGSGGDADFSKLGLTGSCQYQQVRRGGPEDVARNSARTSFWGRTWSAIPPRTCSTTSASTPASPSSSEARAMHRLILATFLGPRAAGRLRAGHERLQPGARGLQRRQAGRRGPALLRAGLQRDGHRRARPAPSTTWRRRYARKELPVSALITYAAIVNAGPPAPLLPPGAGGAGGRAAEAQRAEPRAQHPRQGLHARGAGQVGEAASRGARARQLPWWPPSASAAANSRRPARCSRRCRPTAASTPAPRYLLGVVLADPRFPGRPAEADTLDAAALAAFQRRAGRQGPADRP